MIDRRRFLGLTAGSIVAGNQPLLGAAGGGVAFIRPGAAGYDAGRRTFNSRLSKRPALVAACTTESGVQAAVVRAREMGLPVAVKSGGHSFEGFSVNDGGISIDLGGMDQPQYEARSDTFRVGPGAKLRDVTEYLLKRGRLLPAGSCGSVGIGGLTLGGGYGLFAREFGLTCDHLVGARMVDGSGAVHDTGGGKDGGLLRALRGGGNGNFGVVTELRFHTRPAPTNLHAIRYRYHGLKAEVVIARLRAWFEATKKFDRQTFGAFVLNGQSLTLLVTTTSERGHAPIEAVLTKFLPQPSGKNRSVATSPLGKAVKRYEGRPSPLPFRNASAGYYRGFDDIAVALPEVVELVAKNPGMMFQINTLGGKIREPALVSSYEHRDYGYLGEVQAYWTKPDREAPLMATVAKVQMALRRAGITAHYRNYPDATFKDPLLSYYGEKTLGFLEMLKRKFDPGDVIRHAQSVKPAA
ncbi:MAG: hypothetical protein ACI8XO_003334 [Verrucomicrobiales bacterium]|jgi:hypothetical protein